MLSGTPAEGLSLHTCWTTSVTSSPPAGWFDIDDNKNTNVYVSGWCCKISSDLVWEPLTFPLSNSPPCLDLHVPPAPSSGLPPDISTEEFVQLMSKCGIVMRDPVTEEYKVKLYKDKEGNLKGDGLCCYLKVRLPCCSSLQSPLCVHSHFPGKITVPSSLTSHQTEQCLLQSGLYF